MRDIIKKNMNFLNFGGNFNIKKEIVIKWKIASRFY